jgi:hypothetical protein
MSKKIWHLKIVVELMWNAWLCCAWDSQTEQLGCGFEVVVDDQTEGSLSCDDIFQQISLGTTGPLPSTAADTTTTHAYD